jgi:hypothetical protein
MAIESTGHSRGNPRIYELIENAPKTGKSPTIWAWPEVVDWLRIASQPVPGPWPPHQRPRPNPEEESLPVAVAEPPRPAASPRPAAAPRHEAAPPPPTAAPGEPSTGPRYGLLDTEEASPTRGVGLLDT